MPSILTRFRTTGSTITPTRCWGSGCRPCRGSGSGRSSGQKLYAARAQVNPAALAAHGIGIEDVRNALVNATVNQPKGAIEGADQIVALETNDQLFNANAYGNIIIAYRNGAPVRIKDVGNALDSVQNTRVGAWFNNKPAEGRSEER